MFLSLLSTDLQGLQWNWEGWRVRVAIAFLNMLSLLVHTKMLNFTLPSSSSPLVVIISQQHKIPFEVRSIVHGVNTKEHRDVQMKYQHCLKITSELRANWAWSSALQVQRKNEPTTSKNKLFHDSLQWLEDCTLHVLKPCICQRRADVNMDLQMNWCLVAWHTCVETRCIKKWLASTRPFLSKFYSACFCYVQSTRVFLGAVKSNDSHALSRRWVKVHRIGQLITLLKHQKEANYGYNKPRILCKIWNDF